MSTPLLLSTAYFPPTHYIALAANAERIIIEKEENYIKQTYRNRCYILTANGPIALSVPVIGGSLHKIKIRDIKIDYSKRWQKVHLRGIISSYSASPFFNYFFDEIEKIINKNHRFLLDLNMDSLTAICEMMKIKMNVSYSTLFEPVRNDSPDLRYFINPKNKGMNSMFRFKSYQQVFSDRYDFIPGLSSLDLIFNTGPDASNYLPEIM